MSQNKKPDWDKITEGKIRHGFAVAAFEGRMKLTKELTVEINKWVRYVVDGKIDEIESKPVTQNRTIHKTDSGHISNALKNIMPKNIVEQTNGEVEIRSIIEKNIQRLSEDKRKAVLESLDRGDINKGNIAVCLERINALANDKK